ncbi:hypothetical protein P171DRAFT_231958 [Karstenula rhodostoma CBS 690.94]|uniref:Uncharacterized protein n=1 Tax=Karstenula rhodostoma CBS 690.94 TaxID=1392251 RepID=A0A9P4PP44_9PLEO|nr:hypothetical protein P171DRAFT_231958 [Karstenula rhodostoma CBS 690.94]
MDIHPRFRLHLHRVLRTLRLVEGWSKVWTRSVQSKNSQEHGHSVTCKRIFRCASMWRDLERDPMKKSKGALGTCVTVRSYLALSTRTQPVFMVPSTFRYLHHLEILGAANIVSVAQSMGPAHPGDHRRLRIPASISFDADRQGYSPHMIVVPPMYFLISHAQGWSFVSVAKGTHHGG